MHRSSRRCPCTEATRLSWLWLPWLWSSWLWLPWFSSLSANGFDSNPRIVEHPQSTYLLRNEPATLHCRAEGHPLPVVMWYHNGEPVRTSNRKTIEANGDLVFGRFLQKLDAGVYQCRATNTETLAATVSKTATIDTAMMEHDFRLHPKSSMSLIGGRVELECLPPRGRPEPRVKWKKDGVGVVNGSQWVVFTESGNLVLENLRKEDLGSYRCIAYNSASERESEEATVSLAEKPEVFAVIKELTAGVNSTVLIQCIATGVPRPELSWRKASDSFRPTIHGSRRWMILEDGRLRIEAVQVTDNGDYICTAENDFGWQSDRVHLEVHAPPSFLVAPVDRVVPLGRRSAFQCKVTGSPRPSVFWSREPVQMLMFPSEDHGRFSVSDDGTLMIDSVRREDSGEYTCKALSTAGIAVARATLDVRDSLVYLPPVIIFGPGNQSLPVSQNALLPCSASGDPQPTIKWTKDGGEIRTSDDDHRVSVLHSGSLFISELQSNDTGSYTCVAVNDFGESSRSGMLLVHRNSDDGPVTLTRAPDLGDLPGPPSTPVPVTVTDSSVELTWKSNWSDTGMSQVRAYSVEYFGQDATETWTLVPEEIQNETYTVRSLQPDTYYVFIVRASNGLGIGRPSPVSQPIKTKGIRSKPAKGVISERISGHVIGLFQPEVVNSTAIKLSWELRKGIQSLNGVLIKYRSTYEHMTSSLRHLLPEFSTVVIRDSDVTSYTLIDLTSCTWYEIRVLPNFLRQKGQHGGGGMIKVRTAAAAPSQPPTNITVTAVNGSTVILRWEHPSMTSSSCFYEILGFKIYIRMMDNTLDEEIVVNATVGVVYIHHLLQNATYQLRISAYNGEGESEESNVISIGRNQVIKAKTNLPTSWVVMALALATALVLWLGICLICIGRHSNNAAIEEKLKDDKILNKDVFCKEYRSTSRSLISMTSSNPQVKDSDVNTVANICRNAHVLSECSNEGEGSKKQTSGCHRHYVNLDFPCPALSTPSGGHRGHKGQARLQYAFYDPLSDDILRSKVRKYSNAKDIETRNSKACQSSVRRSSKPRSPVIFLPSPPSDPPSPLNPLSVPHPSQNPIEDSFSVNPESEDSHFLKHFTSSDVISDVFLRQKYARNYVNVLRFEPQTS